MSQRGNITLTDGASTPVNHVFYPVDSQGNVLNWVDRTATAIAAGQAKLSVSQKSSTKQSPTYKLSWKLVEPVLAVTSPSTGSGIQPAPSVAYTNLATLEFVLHERSTAQERKDLLYKMRDLIDEAILTDQVIDYNLIW